MFWFARFPASAFHWAAQAKRASTVKPAAPAATGTTPSETDKIVDALASAARQAMEQMFAKKG